MDYSERTRNVLYKDASAWFRDHPLALKGSPVDVVISAAVHDALDGQNAREAVGQVAVERRLRRLGDLNPQWDQQSLPATGAVSRWILLIAGILVLALSLGLLFSDLTVGEFIGPVYDKWLQTTLVVTPSQLDALVSTLFAIGAVLLVKSAYAAAIFASSGAFGENWHVWVLLVAPILEECVKRVHMVFNIGLPLFEWYIRTNRNSPHAYLVLVLHWVWSKLHLSQAISAHMLYNGFVVTKMHGAVAALELPFTAMVGQMARPVIRGTCVVDGAAHKVLDMIRGVVRVTGSVTGCDGVPPVGLSLHGIGLLKPSSSSHLTVARSCTCNLLAGVWRRLIPAVQRASVVPKVGDHVVKVVIRSLRSIKKQIVDVDTLYEKFLGRYTRTERMLLDYHEHFGERPHYGTFPKIEKSAKDPTEGLQGDFKPRVIICPSWRARGYEGHYLGLLGEALRLLSKLSLDRLRSNGRRGWVGFGVPFAYSSGMTPEECAEFIELSVARGKRRQPNVCVLSLDASNFDGSVSAQLLGIVRQAHLALLRNRVPRYVLKGLDSYLRARIDAPITVRDASTAKIHLPAGVRSGSQDTSSGDTLCSLILAKEVAAKAGYDMYGILINGDDVVMVCDAVEPTLVASTYGQLGFDMSVSRAAPGDWSQVEFSGMRGYACIPFVSGLCTMDWTFRPTLGRACYKLGWSVHSDLGPAKSRGWARGTALSLLGGESGLGLGVGMPIIEAWCLRTLELTTGTRAYYTRQERRDDVFLKTRQPFRACDATYCEIAAIYEVDKTSLIAVQDAISNASLGTFVDRKAQAVVQRLYDVDCGLR